MSIDVQTEPPDVAALLGSVVQRVPRAQQPLLIAFAERLAAARYRAWSDEPAVASHRSELRACAAREEEIAARIEGLFPDAAATQAAIVKANPDLPEINRTLFADRALAQQFRMQAQGERAGAAVWRAFAEHAPDAASRAVFLACADLEEQSAGVLESLIGKPAGPT